MKNPFGRAAREPEMPREPVLDSKLQREREDNERFLQQVYANAPPGSGRQQKPAFESVPLSAAIAVPVPTSTAAIELLDVARELLQGREDVESKVVRVLIGRAIDLLPKRDQAA